MTCHTRSTGGASPRYEFACAWSNCRAAWNTCRRRRTETVYRCPCGSSNAARDHCPLAAGDDKWSIGRGSWNEPLNVRSTGAPIWMFYHTPDRGGPPHCLPRDTSCAFAGWPRSWILSRRPDRRLVSWPVGAIDCAPLGWRIAWTPCCTGHICTASLRGGFSGGCWGCRCA